MEDDNTYTGKPSREYQSRELEAFGKESRFKASPIARMFDKDWANSELIPLLRHAYSKRLGVGEDYDFWNDLDQAEIVEPWHMPDYPVHDPIFIERLRLALANPERVQQPGRIVSITQDMQLTIRLFIRRYVLHGGVYKLFSLGMEVRPELAGEVMEADAADKGITGLFAQK